MVHGISGFSALVDQVYFVDCNPAVFPEKNIRGYFPFFEKDPDINRIRKFGHFSVSCIKSHGS